MKTKWPTYENLIVCKRKLEEQLHQPVKIDAFHNSFYVLYELFNIHINLKIEIISNKCVVKLKINSV